MSSNKVCVVEKTSGEKMWSYLRRNPDDFDVTFCVGQQKEEVKGVKLILKSASAELEHEFSGKWECAVSNKSEGIPLPDFDPKAFQLFIKLLILDTWSADALKNLNLPSQEILNLLQVCRRFGISSAVKNLEVLLENFIREFHSYVTTEEFLRMSRVNLESVISSDKILMTENDLFEAICKWAEFQCREKEIEATGENVRHVLRGCLFQIRFPLMSSSEFRSIRLKNVLLAEERLAIYDFIALTDQGKKSFESSELPFKTHARTSVLIKLPAQAFHPNCLTLSLSEDQIIESSTPFICNGTAVHFEFEPNQRISLHGIGFLGPIDADAKYDVTVEIQSFHLGQSPFQNIRKTLYLLQRKQIFASKSKPFYYIFDNPVLLCMNRQRDNYFGYELYYSLKGPPTPGYKRPDGMDQQVGAVTFKSRFTSGCQPISEIIFQKE